MITTFIGLCIHNDKDEWMQRYFHGNMVLELVFVSNNDKGEFLKSKTLHRNHVHSPKEAEAMGLKDSLLSLRDEKFQRVTIEWRVVFNCKDFKYCSVLYFWISLGSLHTLYLGYFMLKVLDSMDCNLVMVDFLWNLFTRILVLVAIT
ncbi:hypothetical protein P8452_08574 [Trifolium repens]|nr:hypothetical protein QL285_051506 [Trifolium repens]WJX18811.1 hypothetical protein P8452_08574 [Trifolium repens]